MSNGDWIDPREALEYMRSGTGEGIKIAVIDSGVESAHPGLGGLVLKDDLVVEECEGGTRVLQGSGQDLSGHGTAVAGIIRSLAPSVEIGSFRVLSENLVAHTGAIADAARLAMQRGYHVLNCSFGCALMGHVFAYKEWIDEAFLKGVHVVAASSSIDQFHHEWPGHFCSVLAVDKIDAPDELLRYWPGQLVGFGTHGVNVRVPWRGAGWKDMSGSSFAAARLSALLGRMLSKVPTLHPLEAKALLQRVAVLPGAQKF